MLSPIFSFFFSYTKQQSRKNGRHLLDAKVLTPPESIHGRTTFCCNYSAKSFGICLYELCTSRNCNSWPFLLAEYLKLSWIGWIPLCTAIFKSCHRFSIRLRYGLKLDHYQTSKFFALNYSRAVLAVCLESLSLWKVSIHPGLKPLAD